jgi:hypothetical protein
MQSCVRSAKAAQADCRASPPADAADALVFHKLEPVGAERHMSPKGELAGASESNALQLFALVAL